MIRVNGLSKSFGAVKAVDGISFSVEKGSIWGFVGPNGSGKTTTLRVLATLLVPDAGSAEIAGIDVVKNPREARAKLGFMPDFFGVYDTLKVWEYLKFYASAYDMDEKLAAQRSDELLELVELAHKKYAYVDTLSRGMKQRLGLARALIHDPEVLLLDEPASGLDPKARVELREILKKLMHTGKTVIISSHILPELAEMCTEIGIMQNGRLLVTGSVAEIMAKMQYAQEIVVNVLNEEAIFKAQKIIRSFTGNEAHLYGRELRFNMENIPHKMSALLKELISAGVEVVEYKTSEHNLEDVFIKITGEADK